MFILIQSETDKKEWVFSSPNIKFSKDLNMFLTMSPQASKHQAFTLETYACCIKPHNQLKFKEIANRGSSREELII